MVAKNAFPTEVNRELRGHRFYPTATELRKLPKLYSQDGKGADAIVVAHYFSSATDHWVTEYGKGEDLGDVFGYAKFASFPQGAEWGYSCLFELEELKVVKHGLPIIIERDLNWVPKPANECVPDLMRRA